MTRRTDFLHVPAFWSLRTLYGPILALLIAVTGGEGAQFADRQDNRILGVPTRQKWPLEPMQGEAAIHHPAPECEGVIAA